MNDTEDNRAACPHCGKTVDPLRAPAVSVVAGKIAHFCSSSCREQHLQRTNRDSDPAPAPFKERLEETQEASEQMPRQMPRENRSQATEGTEVPPQVAPKEAMRKERIPRFAKNTAALFPFLKSSFITLALQTTLLIIAFGLPAFITGMVPVLIVGAGVIAFGAYGGYRHRRRGFSIIAPNLATPLAALIVLASSFWSTDPRTASIVAASLLLLEGIGHMLEIVGRMRSGVEQVIEGTSNVEISSSWRDNSPLAASLRRFSLILDWARFPLAAIIGICVYFFYENSLSNAMVGAATALVALGPRAIRMSTGDAHLSAALLASARGVTIRDAHVLDRLSISRLILFMAARSLFKKTLSIVDWSMAENGDRESALAALGALEQHVTGRIPSAILAFVKSAGVQCAKATDVTAIKGKGLIGSTEAGQAICGSRALLLENGISTAMLEEKASIIEKSGRRALFLGVDETAVAVFGLEETPVPGAETIALKLKALGLEPILMTSAEIEAAQSLALRLGMDNVRFQVRDEELGELIGHLNQTGENTILVGSGSDFEEHLGAAAASVAVAGEAATQAGVDARNVSITTLPWIVDIAKYSKRSTEINLVQSASAMAMGLALALGWFSPYTVVFGGAFAFGAAAFSTLNGPYPGLDRFLSKTTTFVTKVRKRAIKKWATLR